MARTFVAASSQFLKSASTPVSATPLTLACLVKPTTLPQQVVLSVGTLASLNAHLLYLGATSGIVNAYTQTPGGNGAATAAAVSAGAWSHVAGVFASATSRTAYTNGVAGTPDATNLTPSGMDHVSVGMWFEGATSVLPADAAIAEAAIWNVALTAAEIASLALGVSPQLVRPSALVFYAPLIGHTSPEIELVGRRELTVSGATASAHPRIFAPLGQGLFTTRTTAPSTPASPAPANGATHVSSGMLSWGGGSGADTFSVAFDTVNPPVTTVVASQVGNSYTATLLPSTTYYWKITATNGVGSTVGPVWSFTTRAATEIELLVGGVDRSTCFDRDSFEILDELNELPNTCSFECFGFVPADEAIVRVMQGVVKEFEGTITTIDEYHDRLNARTVYRVTCTDYTRDFDADLVTKKYGSQSATAIAQDIVSTRTSGFTQVHIAASLPNVDAIQFKMTPPSSALRQLCDAFGGDPYVDYDKDVHVFITETDVVPDTWQASNTDWRGFKYRRVFTGIKTRALVEGLGTTSTSAVAPGATSIPVDDPSAFSAAGGSVVAGNQVITYTGISAGGTTVTGGSTTVAARPSPTATPSLAQSATADDSHGPGNFRFKVTFIYSDGAESPPSPSSASVTIGGTRRALIGTEVGDANVTSRGTYWDFGGSGSYDGRNVLADNITTSFDLKIANVGATSALPPSSDPAYAAGGTILYVNDTSIFSATGGYARVGGDVFSYTGRSTSSGVGALTGIPAAGVNAIGGAIAIGATIEVVYAEGSTSLAVADTSNFSSGGGQARTGSQVFSYTGRSTTSGAGSLTGIPASGAGAFSATVVAGDTVLVGAGGNGTLSGIPTSGVGSIIDAISQGDEINLLVQRDDAAAQATYGVRTVYIQDRRLSIAGAEVRGDAELTLRKDPTLSGSGVTGDTKVRSGRRLTVSMASQWNISGTFTITKVRVFLAPDRIPLQREVTFTNHATENDLYRLIRQFNEERGRAT